MTPNIKWTTTFKNRWPLANQNLSLSPTFSSYLSLPSLYKSNFFANNSYFGDNILIQLFFCLVSWNLTRFQGNYLKNLGIYQTFKECKNHRSSSFKIYTTCKEVTSVKIPFIFCSFLSSNYLSGDIPSIFSKLTTLIDL